jgi:hypothetical protein
MSVERQSAPSAINKKTQLLYTRDGTGTASTLHG